MEDTALFLDRLDLTPFSSIVLLPMSLTPHEGELGGCGGE